MSATEQLIEPKIEPGSEPGSEPALSELASDLPSDPPFDSSNEPSLEAISDAILEALSTGPCLHNQTPLMHSTTLTRRVRSHVHLKLENLQPSGSFKIRGLAHLCQTYTENSHLVTSSGGNAGLAVAYIGRQLSCRVTIVCPKSTSLHMRNLIEAERADCVVYGEAWDEADRHARDLVVKYDKGVYIPPFDHPYIWAGHATMVREIWAQMNGQQPDAVLCAVGGGGLLNGLIVGLQEVGWTKVPIIAVETHGANSFQQSVLAGKLVTLDNINTIATSMGAKTICAKTLELARLHPVIPFSVSDAMAANACQKFADEHRMLVEAACGAVLSVCYSNVIRDILPTLHENSHIVAIVCGGSNITLDMLEEYRHKFADPPVIVKGGSEIFMTMRPDGDNAVVPQKE